ncbi:hypothetical protein M9434_004526 [Picochlorum sp. BPE23]|nr:hypothetical protein M9434_004526 [Picochlorum sp. BPE23]
MTHEIALATLNKYRKLLRLIKRLPKEEARLQAVQEARTEFQKHKTAPEGEADRLREKLDDKIRYLRIVTPKQPGDADNIEESTVFVVRDGKVVEGTAARVSRVADGKMSMSEAQERHQSLLRRQYFGREPPRYDPSKF